MGFLRTDYSDVNAGFEPLPIGDYECIVSKVEVTETKETKKPMIKVTLTVRDDVEQKGQKRKYFDNLVVQDNMMWKFHQVSKACDLPEGEDFDTPEQFAEAILYKNVAIRNKHRVYNGETQDTVNVWKESNAGSNPFEGSDSGSLTIGDDDLPF